MATKFWEQKTLAELNPTEWESLCDGCGKCCLNKITTDDPDEFLYTRIACRLLDTDSCRCSNYENRFQHVKACEQLTPQTVKDLKWLPNTCAYRLVAQRQPLPAWHHLVCGDKNAIHAADESVRGGIISEEFVHEDGWDEHIIQWVSN